MKLFDKRCPDCAAAISISTYLRVKSHRFKCPKCGAQLLTSSINRVVVSAATGSIFIAIPISNGLADHRWWWALIPGFVLYAFWSYLLMQPQSYGSS